jgi:hypothetical protein
LGRRGGGDSLRRSPIPITNIVSNAAQRNREGILTRTAKHSDQFAGTTTVITDGYDIIEYTVIGLSEIRKDIDEDICSLGHDCQSFDLK